MSDVCVCGEPSPCPIHDGPGGRYPHISEVMHHLGWWFERDYLPRDARWEGANGILGNHGPLVGAAMLLKGHFTWEDVDLLRVVLSNWDGVIPDEVRTATNQEYERLDSLPDRIASLLPPRETP